MTTSRVHRLLGSVVLIAALAACGSDYDSNSPGGTDAPAQAPGATAAGSDEGSPGGYSP